MTYNGFMSYNTIYNIIYIYLCVRERSTYVYVFVREPGCAPDKVPGWRSESNLTFCLV